MATGDELVASGSAHESAYAIPDALGPALGAMIQHAGGKVVSRGFVRDDLPALERLAGQLAQNVDLVVVTGGASVGEHDFAKPMFAAHGLELQFDRVAMKPGKPVWFGRVKDCWVIGLPGNPTSAMVTARLLLDPILGRLQGATRGHLWRSMPLASALPATGDRETFARARWDATGLTALGNQDSGVQGGLAKADWLIRCPPGQSELAAGTMVSALQF
ncbi:MAG: molybdopterin-binding protein [Pseudomonadota bacterium]|nr:molybdopterin-binding protein [Pseudomonadota bacterium]